MKEVDREQFIELLNNDKIGNVLIGLDDNNDVFFYVKLNGIGYVYKNGYIPDIMQFCTNHLQHHNINIGTQLFESGQFERFTNFNIWHNGNVNVFLNNRISDFASDDLQQKFNFEFRLEKFISLGIFHVDVLDFNYHTDYYHNKPKLINLLQKYNVPLTKEFIIKCIQEKIKIPHIHQYGYNMNDPEFINAYVRKNFYPKSYNIDPDLVDKYKNKI